MVGMRIADVQEDIDHELISKEEIADIINHAAAQASEDYRGKNPLLVCVLKGAVNTLAAFSQAMSIHAEMDFMSLSSYGSGTQSSGKITVRQDLSTDVRGRHVLIGKTSSIRASRWRGSSMSSKAVVPLPWRFLRCWKSRRAVRWMFL